MSPWRRRILLDILAMSAKTVGGDRGRLEHHLLNHGRRWNVTPEECRAVLGMTVAELVGIEGGGTEANDVATAVCGDVAEETARFLGCSGARGNQGNIHPTLKSIALCTYLARLILPPPHADGSPRRLLVPFAGTGSEMIGALLAGWDEVVGIESEPVYCEIGEARIKAWTRAWDEAEQVGLFG